MMHDQTNIKKWIGNGVELFVTAILLITTFFMTLFILTVTAVLALIVALKLRWRRPAQAQQPVDNHSKETIIDAEYTIVDKK